MLKNQVKVYHIYCMLSENQNIIRRELRMLSGEYVSADGLPLPKSAIETLIKYTIFTTKNVKVELKNTFQFVI